MSDYFDTGVLIKLYTAEPESALVQAFVTRRARALPITDLLALEHAGATGCRTLDTLHVASARVLGFARLVTTDRRQAALAERAGLRAVDPLDADR